MPRARPPATSASPRSTATTPDRPLGRRGEPAPSAGRAQDLEAAVADLVAVILQEDVALDPGAEAGDVLELAPGDGRLQLRAAEIVLEDLPRVQPVLDVVALDQDARLVPLAHRAQGLVPGGREDVVEGGRLAVRPDPGVGVPAVEDLVFMGDRTVAPLGHEVLHAAVPARSDAPLETQVEIGEGVEGHDVTAPVRVPRA